MSNGDELANLMRIEELCEQLAGSQQQRAEDRTDNGNYIYIYLYVKKIK